MTRSAMSLTVLAVAALVLALSFVTWRQTRALEALAQLDRVERDVSLLRAERGELERRIQTLESRGRVVPVAREWLDMRMPSASEIILLSIEEDR